MVETAAKTGYEDCLRITGTVRRRQNPNRRSAPARSKSWPTKIEVLNKAEPLPFPAHENPGEDVRLKYRYLDLRTPDMQRKMRTRTEAGQRIARMARTRAASRTSRRRS